MHVRCAGPTDGPEPDVGYLNTCNSCARHILRMQGQSSLLCNQRVHCWRTDRFRQDFGHTTNTVADGVVPRESPRRPTPLRRVRSAQFLWQPVYPAHIASEAILSQPGQAASMYPLRGAPTSVYVARKFPAVPQTRIETISSELLTSGVSVRRSSSGRMFAACAEDSISPGIMPYHVPWCQAPFCGK